MKELKEAFAITSVQAGAIVSVCGATMVIGMLLFGYLSDKYSRKKLIIIGCSISAVFAFLTSYVPNYQSLLIVRSLDGIGIGAFLPLSYAMTADYMGPEDRGKLYAWLGIILGLGTGLGYFSGGMAPEYGWNYIFKYIGILQLIVIALFYFTVYEPERAESEPEFEEMIAKGEKYPYRIKRSQLKVVWKRPTNLFLITQSLPGALVGGLAFTWIITYLEAVQGLSKMFAIMCIGVGGLMGMITGRLLAGYLGDVLSKRGYRRGRMGLVILGLSVGLIFGLLFTCVDFPSSYKFKADAENMVGDLDNGIIPNELENKFVNEGYSLPKGTSLSVEENGKLWMISKNKEDIYRIGKVLEKGENKLYICKSVFPKDVSISDFPRVFVMVLSYKGSMLAIIFLTIASFFSQFSSPNVYATVQNINEPEVRGTINSLNNCTDSLGFVTGPVVGGAIEMTFGLRNAIRWGYIFLVPCIILFIGAYFKVVQDKDDFRKVMEEKAEELKRK